MAAKRVLIAGGTGFLGTTLATRLEREGYTVSILTRAVPHTDVRFRYVLWDGTTIGPWTDELNQVDVVINVCGKSVNCRYTEANKREIVQSRVNSTKLIGEAIARAATPPAVWINASSSAYYGFSHEPMDERSPPGDDFPATICKVWEEAFFGTPAGIRKVAWRTAVVLQRDTGLLMPFVNLVRTFAGGKLGSGQQYFTWIHEEDFLRAALWTIETSTAEGAYNVTSPEPVTNEVFMKALRKALCARFAVSLPSWLLWIGGKITGTEPYLILEGRRIKPGRLQMEDFRFVHPEIEEALEDLCADTGS